MAIWLSTINGERYRLRQRAGQTDDEIMRALMDGNTREWAPVVHADGGWMMLNLAHVLRIEAGPDEDIRDSFKR